MATLSSGTPTCDWPTVSGVEDNLASNGGIFVMDHSNFRVVHWALGAEAGTVVAGGQGFGDRLDQLTDPHDVALAPDGGVFVADGGTDRVVHWAPGAEAGWWAGQGRQA